MLGCVPGGRLCWVVSLEVGCVGLCPWSWAVLDCVPGAGLCWIVSLELGCVGLCP